MKIVIPVIDFAPNGGYRVLAELASAWVRSGHRVSFLCKQTSAPPYFPSLANVIWLDSAGNQTQNDYSGMHVCGARAFVEMMRTLLRGLNRYASDADVILANQSFTAWPTYFCRSRAHKYYYVQAYEPEYYDAISFNHVVAKCLSALSYWLKLKRIVNSPIYCKYKNLKSRHVVPPGIDFSIYQPGPYGEFKKGANGAVRIGCIGRREPVKGTRYALEAYRVLMRKGYKVEMYVAYGNIPQDFNQDAVTVVQPKNDRELADYYRSLDVLMAPGLVQHGAPHYPVMEAMACGVPVVTTGYLPADASNSWLVPVADAQAIADAVVRIVSDDEDRKMRVAKALDSIRQYSWDSLADRMMSVFRGEGSSHGDRLVFGGGVVL